MRRTNPALQTQMKILQINLHHAKAASAVLSRRFICQQIGMALIQEPWTVGNLIKGLPKQSGKLIYDNGTQNPRAAILVSSQVNCIPIPEFISRDLVAVMIEVLGERGKQEIVVASAYFPGDSDTTPPSEGRRLVAHLKKKGLNFLIGCDANAHHTVWGSSDINNRGEYLFDYLITNNIDFVNRGKKPTFINAIRQEVLDLTLASPHLSHLIKNWHVSEEASLSDHMHIRFDLETETETMQQQEARIPKLTDWDLYKVLLGSEMPSITGNIESPENLEFYSKQLHTSIHSAFENSCPVKRRKPFNRVPWWNEQLEKLKKKSRRLFNKAKRTGEWGEYKLALTEYNLELRRSKRATWRSFCEGINEVPSAVRLQKVLAKDHSNGIGFLQKADASFTESRKETIGLLLETHFPDSVVTQEQEDSYDGPNEVDYSPHKRTWSLSGSIFTHSKVRWAIGSFKPFKSPGGDGIFPALLQKGIEEILPNLVRIIRASFAFNYIPRLWRKVNVVFIPKGGGRPDTQPKAYRPISLTSFLLKTMEKVLDHHIRSEILKGNPLHRYQFAYQTGKSTVTALSNLVTKIEKAIFVKEIALCAFIDIEGAFDNTSYESIERAANGKGIEPPTIRWIRSILKHRIITAQLGSESVTIKAVKGCPQGGVLSPLLWSLVVDGLLTMLSNRGLDVQGYADDLTVIISGKYDNIISELMQDALKLIWQWCRQEGLSINPNKTVIVPFTKRRKLTLTNPTLNGTIINFSKEVKYLGVILDRKLNWREHLQKIQSRATKALWACKRLYGRTWGLKPRMIYWSFLTIIRPMVTYASLVWWPKTEEKVMQTLLYKVQRMACLGITGAMKTCPTAAMEALLGLTPLHLHIKKEAAAAALRMQTEGNLKPGNMVGHLKILREFQADPLTKMPSDSMPAVLDFNKPFSVIIPDRDCWGTGGLSFDRGSMVWYTDGSKSEEGVGIGIYGNKTALSKSLGSNATIFQAEMHAIELCARIGLSRGLRSAKVYIISDSQAALKALNSVNIESRLVWDCLNVIKQLATKNRVTLMWSPGHTGIKGNENADGLARAGAASAFIGPEPFCGVTKEFPKAAVKRWEDREKSSYWHSIPGLRQAKRFISPSLYRVEELLVLSKPELRLLTGFLTGHAPLRYHLKKWA